MCSCSHSRGREVDGGQCGEERGRVQRAVVAATTILTLRGIVASRYHRCLVPLSTNGTNGGVERREEVRRIVNRPIETAL